VAAWRGGIRLTRLPIELVRRAPGGKIVGRLWRTGEELLENPLLQNPSRRLGDAFIRIFKSIGEEVPFVANNGFSFALKAGGRKTGFAHIIRRHLVQYWDGTLPKSTNFWPGGTSASDLIDMLSEVASKHALNEGTNIVQLSNGISVQLVIREGAVHTFYPLRGPGIIHSADLIRGVM